MKFQTKAVHMGQKPDKQTGAVVPPIYQTSTYGQEAPGEHHGFEYTRAGNPNFQNLEAAIAALEGGKYAVVFSSGMGAAMGLLMQLSSGDHVIATEDAYGGMYRALTRLSVQFGLRVSYISGDDADELQQAITPQTKYLWLESPTNPLLNVIDIRTLANVARQKGVAVIVDNTFATPALQSPLELGADVVLHSTTKYIGGHSDVIGGAIVTDDDRLAAGADFSRKAYGFNPSPFDVWLTHRGIKTLGLRMAQHCRGGAALAAFLSEHALVSDVFYPGLSSHRGHDIAALQMKGFGGMVSARFNVPVKRLKQHLARFRFFRLAESLGGVESLICHPATMTHASVPAELREQRGIRENLVRFSVGIEDSDDLIADVKEVLDSLR